jgi:hypothetical protein
VRPRRCACRSRPGRLPRASGFGDAACGRLGRARTTQSS